MKELLPKWNMETGCLDNVNDLIQLFIKNVGKLIIEESIESFSFHHNVKLRTENKWNADKNYNGKYASKAIARHLIWKTHFQMKNATAQ